MKIEEKRRYGGRSKSPYCGYLEAGYLPRSALGCPVKASQSNGGFSFVCAMMEDDGTQGRRRR